MHLGAALFGGPGGGDLQRFSRAKSSVGRTGGPAVVALVAGLLCGVSSMMLEGLRRLPDIFPFPALSLRAAAGLLAGILLLNAGAVLLSRHPRIPWTVRLLAAPGPS